MRNQQRSRWGRLAVLLAILGLASGCAYGFSSSLLPGHIKTIAIPLLENQTDRGDLSSVLAESLAIAKPGVAQQISLALRSLDLPVAIPDHVPHEAIIRAMNADKKRADGAVRFALPAAIGDVRTGIEVRDLQAALVACLAPGVLDRVGVDSSPTARAPTPDHRSSGEQG